ncbi:MAG TPA: EamA family transporter [Gaiellaceae bacterium]
MVAVLLALAASASWGVSDFLGGLASRRLTLATVMGLTTPIGLVAIGVLVAIRWQAPPSISFILWGALTGVLGAAGISSLYRGLTVGRMGVVAPISATAPLIPVTVGLARGERPSALQGIGMGLALVGVVLTGREHDSETGRRVASGAIFGLIAAVTFGGSLISLDQAANSDPYWATLVLRAAATFAVAAALLVTRSPVRAPRSVWPTLTAIAVLDIAGTVFFAVSTTKGLISVVSVLVSLVPVYVAFLARFVLHERLERVQLAGASSAVAGVVLISAG